MKEAGKSASLFESPATLNLLLFLLKNPIFFIFFNPKSFNFLRKDQTTFLFKNATVQISIVGILAS